MRLLVGPVGMLADLRSAHGFVRAAAFRSPGAAPAAWGEGVRACAWIAHDIAEPRPGLKAPTAAQVAELLALRWSGVLALGCYAGISRSPAAAFALACREAAPGREAALAQALRRAAPSVTPNPRIVALADAELGRGGRMSAAVAAIGRGAEAFQGEALLWDLASGAVQRAAATPSSTPTSASCSTAPSTSPV